MTRSGEAFQVNEIPNLNNCVAIVTGGEPHSSALLHTHSVFRCPVTRDIYANT